MATLSFPPFRFPFFPHPDIFHKSLISYYLPSSFTHHSHAFLLFTISLYASIAYFSFSPQSMFSSSSPTPFISLIFLSLHFCHCPFSVPYSAVYTNLSIPHTGTLLLQLFACSVENSEPWGSIPWRNGNRWVVFFFSCTHVLSIVNGYRELVRCCVLPPGFQFW